MTQARCEARDNENMGNADPNAIGYEYET